MSERAMRIVLVENNVKMMRNKSTMNIFEGEWNLEEIVYDQENKWLVIS